jgi:hypothetical protein
VDLINSIYDYIKPNNTWESLCTEVYSLLYPQNFFTRVPSVPGGDAGIEGFTDNGIVIQCYFFQKKLYSEEKCFKLCQNKMARDLYKLIHNGKRLKNLGVPEITEWHFLIPELPNLNILLVHCQRKCLDILEQKRRNPLLLSHISPNFKIRARDAIDLTPHIYQLIGIKMGYPLLLFPNLEIKKASENEINILRQKSKALLHIDNDSDDILKGFIDAITDDYESGRVNVPAFFDSNPDLKANFSRLSTSFRREVIRTTATNDDFKRNMLIYNQLATKLQDSLGKMFSIYLNDHDVTDIKAYLLSQCLVDCALHFRR